MSRAEEQERRIFGHGVASRQAVEAFQGLSASLPGGHPTLKAWEALTTALLADGISFVLLRAALIACYREHLAAAGKPKPLRCRLCGGLLPV